MKDVQIYLINLDRSVDRLKSMDKKLKKLGLQYERVPAIDGKSTTFSDVQINQKKYSLCHGKYITPTEVACFISHYNTLKHFLEDSEKKYALILEDDVSFSPDFKEGVELLVKNADLWDVVKLNGAHSGGKILFKKLSSKFSLVWNIFHQSKTGAYLVNKKAAKSYVEKLLPMFVPIDHEYIKFWKYGLKGFSLSEYPVVEEKLTSTIDYKMLKRNRKPFYKKLPTLFYKIYIAFRRIIWVLVSILKNRFTFEKK